MEKFKDIHSFISKINKIKENNTKYLIMERLDLVPQDKLIAIETESNLEILDGMKILSYFLPFVLKKLYILLKEDLKSKEVLIFSGPQKLTEEFIFKLSKEVKFITLVGDNEQAIENISKKILESTGLSIFHCKNIDKILKNYHIIINLNENTKIDRKKIRKETIIFDFSLSKTLGSLNNYGVIEDFIFKTNKLNIKENIYMEQGLSSALYEHFNNLEKEDLKGLLVNKQVYDFQNFIGNKIKQSGRL